MICQATSEPDEDVRTTIDSTRHARQHLLVSTPPSPSTQPFAAAHIALAALTSASMPGPQASSVAGPGTPFLLRTPVLHDAGFKLSGKHSGKRFASYAAVHPSTRSHVASPSVTPASSDHAANTCPWSHVTLHPSSPTARPSQPVATRPGRPSGAAHVVSETVKLSCWTGSKTQLCRKTS